MATNPIFSRLNYTSFRIGGKIRKFNNLKVLPQPTFEYIAHDFSKINDNNPEHVIPNCYYEAINFDGGLNQHLRGLNFFKKPILRDTTLSTNSFDPRRYFYNYNFLKDSVKYKNTYEERTNPSRSKIIILTDIKQNSSTEEEDNFYTKGYSLSEFFPSKNIIQINNVTAPIESNLNLNFYMYHFISDMVKGAYDNFFESVTLSNEDNDLQSRRIKINQTLPYYDQDDQWYSDHVALARKDDRINSTKADLLNEFVQLVRNRPAEDYQKTQTVFIKIDKLSESGELLQTIYITPTNDGTVYYADSQIKLETMYTYRLTSYVLVTLNTTPPAGPFAPIGLSSYIYEFPQGEIDLLLFQPPHPRPQVEFKNLSNKKNNIRIGLNLSSNKYTSLQFEGLTEDENSNFFDKYLLFDPNELRDTMFNYETEQGRFQIFRMDRHPLSYFDIGQNARLTETKGQFGSTVAYFTDSLIPFKKYYYLIRSENTYGYFSNPSPIYEVEMTKDANDTFLHVNVVDFFVPDQNKYMSTKFMAKMLQIIPSSYQTTIDRDLVGEGLNELTKDELPVLGIVDKKIWDEKTRFKIRLVSKKTGKKLDLNVKFNLNKNNSE